MGGVQSPSAYWVAVEPLRERFLALQASGQITAKGLARELGWYRRASRSSPRQSIVPDGQRARRALGVSAQFIRGSHFYRRHINRELAMRLCTILGLDPWEVGL